MKKILSVILLLTVLSSLFVALPVFADEPAPEFFKCNIYVGDTLVSEEAIRVNGSTYIPLRTVCEKIGCNVTYDGQELLATIQKGITKITVENKNNYEITIDDYAKGTSAAEMKAINPNGALYIPLRDVLENLFCYVKYNGEATPPAINIASHYAVTPLNHDNFALVNRTKYKGEKEQEGITEKFVFNINDMKKVDFQYSTSVGTVTIEPEKTTEIKDLLLCKNITDPAAFEITTGNEKHYFVIESGAAPEKYADKLSLLDRNNSDILLKSENGQWKKFPGTDSDPLTLTLPNSSFSVTYVPNPQNPLLDKWELDEEALKNDKTWKRIFETYKDNAIKEYEKTENPDEDPTGTTEEGVK